MSLRFSTLPGQTATVSSTTRSNTGIGSVATNCDAAFVGLMSQSDWKQIWTTCCRIIRRWQAPPHWSTAEWLEEVYAEAFAAAMEAMSVFDASRNVAPALFFRGRILARAIARYRKEWAYALRLGPSAGLGETVRPSDGPDEIVASRVDLSQGLSALKQADRDLVESLFWQGETEDQIATRLGISQQAVNKRKKLVLKKLRHILRHPVR